MNTFGSLLHLPSWIRLRLGLPNLCFLLCCLPFCVLSHYEPQAAFYTELTAFTLALLVLICFFWRFNRCMRVPHVTYWLLLFCVLLFWQLKWVTDWRHVVNPIVYLLVTVGLVSVFNHFKLVHTVALGVLCGGLFNAGTIFYQAYTQDLTIGALYQANHTADYLTLATLSAFYLFLTHRMKVYWFYLAVIVLCIAIPFTHSRAVLLYLTAIILISLQVTPRTAFLTLLVLSVPALFLLKDTDGIRLALYSAANDFFLQSPWLGIGFGEYVTTYGPGAWANHSHSLLLNLLAETGLVGTGLILSGLLGWLSDFAASRVSLEKWYVACSLAVLMIHSMLEFPLWYSNFLFIFAIFLGLGAHQLTSYVRVFGAARRILLFLLCLGLVYCLFNIWVYYNRYTPIEINKNDFRVKVITK